jgi:hypothetical protein
VNQIEQHELPEESCLQFLVLSCLLLPVSLHQLGQISVISEQSGFMGKTSRDSMRGFLQHILLLTGCNGSSLFLPFSQLYTHTHTHTHTHTPYSEMTCEFQQGPSTLAWSHLSFGTGTCHSFALLSIVNHSFVFPFLCHTPKGYH